MKKIVFIHILILMSFICDAQTLICWRAETVKYSSSSGQFETTKRYDMNSEAFFSEKYIRINDAGLFLTKQRIKSVDRSSDGVVTIYDVKNDQGYSLVATVVEDINGIFKMFLMADERSIDGIVYYIKNR